MKEFLEKLKALITGVEKDLGTAHPQVFSEAEVKAREEAATKAAKDQTALEFAEKEKQREQGIKAREDALKAKEAEARKTEIVSFVEGLKQLGKIVPAMEKIGTGITNFLIEISSSSQVMEFKEGEETKKQTPLEFMKAFLSGLPKIVEFREVATREKDATGSGGAAEKLDALTKKKMDADKGLSYSEALKAAQMEYPEIAREVADGLRSSREKK